MTSLPPSFFDRLEDRLNIAVFDINEAIRMGLWEVKQALKGYPKQDKARLSRIRGGTTIDFGDQEIEVANSESIDRIKSRLPQVHYETSPDEPHAMSITGLQSGAFEAKLAQMKQRMVDKQNNGLAKIDAKVADNEAKIDAAVAGVEAKVDKEVDDALAEFAKFTNGGPA